MLLAFITLFFVNVSFFQNIFYLNIFYFYIVSLLLVINIFYVKPVYYVNVSNYSYYTYCLCNKFIIKCSAKLISNVLNYRYPRLALSFFFKWSPLFKRTSYFGLYNFSKNK